ncbi:MAG TPA: hypothetical protein VK716_08125 [Terracidiphilus sp.]|jgi:hypothetical protein|nr:hypothetical protein [Terracidiphilus sp.]
MLKKKLALSILFLATSTTTFAQSTSNSSKLANDSDAVGGGYRPAPSVQGGDYSGGAFSRMAIGVGVSPLGAGLQITTNITSHLNIRAIGNGMAYSTNFSTSGFDANAKLNLVSAGASVDIYPFHKGFRISPGVLVLNNNRLTATSVVAGGTSFQLDGDTYYSANANPVTGATPLNASAELGLKTNKPAFTITTGWGNTIPRDGRHWSFPFEVGAAFIGQPSLNATLNGWACYDQAQAQCTDVASTTNPIALQIQNDLTAQVAKWKNDLEPLKTYPIVSFGVAYSFGLRGGVR